MGISFLREAKFVALKKQKMPILSPVVTYYLKWKMKTLLSRALRRCARIKISGQFKKI